MMNCRKRLVVLQLDEPAPPRPSSPFDYSLCPLLGLRREMAILGIVASGVFFYLYSKCGSTNVCPSPDRPSSRLVDTPAKRLAVTVQLTFVASILHPR